MARRAPSRPRHDEARPSRSAGAFRRPCEVPVTPQPATYAAPELPLFIVSRKDANVSNQNL